MQRGGRVADERQAELGAAVRSARQAAGWSLERLSAATRVPGHVLADLEAGRTRSSGAPVYVRGHLRAIAAATGVDPDPLLAAHERLAGAPAPLPAPTVRLPVAQAGSLRVPRPATVERNGPRWAGAAALATAVLAGLAVLGSLTGAPAAAPQPVAAASSSSGPSSQSAPTGAAVEVALTSAAAAARVEVQGSDGRVLLDGRLRAGERRVVRAGDALRVHVRGGEVRLQCAGDAATGSAGRTFTCRADGLVRSGS